MRIWIRIDPEGSPCYWRGLWSWQNRGAAVCALKMPWSSSKHDAAFICLFSMNTVRTIGTRSENIRDGQRNTDSSQNNKLLSLRSSCNCTGEQSFTTARRVRNRTVTMPRHAEANSPTARKIYATGGVSSLPVWCFRHCVVMPVYLTYRLNALATMKTRAGSPCCRLFRQCILSIAWVAFTSDAPSSLQSSLMLSNHRFLGLPHGRWFSG